MVQMYQKDKMGGGEATEEKYVTWTIQECPACGRKVKEYYEALVLKNDDEQNNEIKGGTEAV